VVGCFINTKPFVRLVIVVGVIPLERRRVAGATDVAAQWQKPPIW
jgi:hypothetical protein